MTTKTGQRILVVEDEKAIQSLERDKLERAGYEVDTADDGRQAWEKIQNNEYELILIDIFLPKMDGFQLLNKIKSQRIPVKKVVLSSKSQDRYINKAYNLGADDYLTKPFDSKVVLTTIDNLLEQG